MAFGTMSIHIEFYGIARQRAGTSGLSVMEGQTAARLAEILAELSRRLPAWADACLDRGQLRQGFVASVDGDRFVNDPDTIVGAGQSLLILSSDAGG
jgi:molybdopterin converting factor small subunit